MEIKSEQEKEQKGEREETRHEVTRYHWDINVTDGIFCMNGTTSVPKSVLR